MIDSKLCWLKENCNQIDCESNSCIRLTKLDYLYDKAGIPLNLRHDTKLKIIDGVNSVDKEKFKQLNDIKSNIKEFVESGKNLYLYSDNCGNGKTLWTIKLLQSYFNSIWPTTSLRCRALFIHVPSFLLALKDNISEKSEYIKYIKENITECDLVIFDELTTRAATNYELDHLLAYLNNRLTNCKSCIYTSNVKPYELSSYIGERLTSRVINLSECIELKGDDMRSLCKGGNC